MELSLEQLKNPEIATKVQNKITELVEHPETKEAYNVVGLIEKNLTNLKLTEPGLFGQYQKALAQMRLIALPMLDDEIVIKLVRGNFVLGLESEIDLESRFIAKLFGLPFGPRDEFRQQLQTALKNNQEKIGALAIKEWLADYDAFADFRSRTNIAPTEYLIRSRKIQGLTEKDKQNLRKLFHFYDNLLLVTPVLVEPLLSQAIAEAGKTKMSIPAVSQSIPSSLPPLPITPLTPAAPAPTPPSAPPPPISPIPAPLIPPPIQPTSTPPVRPVPPIPAQPITSIPKIPGQDSYREPVPETPPMPSPLPPAPHKPSPRLDGNIIDLKNLTE